MIENMSVHPTAIIEDGAIIAESAKIGPFCTIGSQVTIADDVQLLGHVSVSGRTTIGSDVMVHPFAVLGGPPQHLGYNGEDTQLIIGSNVIIREHVTMNIGTQAGGGITRIGNHCMFMVGAHVAHDCKVSDHVIFANNATLGGHVRVGRNVFLGGLSAVHQFSRIGDFSFVGGCAAVTSDLIPYGSAMGNHARLVGLNVIGMKRNGVDRETIHRVRGAYKALFESSDNFVDRLANVKATYSDIKQISEIISFIEDDASRSLMGPAR